MQAVADAVREAGPFAQDVARILYGAMGIAIPEDAAQKSEGPHTSYHRVDRQQAQENAAKEGADAPKTAPDSEPAPPADPVMDEPTPEPEPEPENEHLADAMGLDPENFDEIDEES